MFAENDVYEILTPTGWKNFRGITLTPNKTLYEIKLKSGDKVTATAEHCFYVNTKRHSVSQLKIGDKLDLENGFGEIISIEESRVDTVYDIIEVDNKDHQFIVNNCFVTKNCDEFSFVRPSIAADFWTSISPTLATGGKCIITSTPSSDEDQFALLWKNANKCIDAYGNPTELGINGFKAFTCHWSDHPDRDQHWADNMRAQLGDDRFEREINCRFISAEETLIAPAKLADLEKQEPIFKIGQVRWYKQPKRDSIYCVALDPSVGTGGDYAAIQVYEANTTEQVAEWQHNRTPIQEQIRILAGICDYLHEFTEDDKTIYYSVENNSVGEAALVSIAEYGEPNIKGYFLCEPGKQRKGFSTTRRTKIAACNKLKMLVERDKMKISSGPLISELKTFVAKGMIGYEAKAGEHDDLVSATLIAVRMLQTLQSYYPELDNRIKDHADVIAPMPFVVMMG